MFGDSETGLFQSAGTVKLRKFISECRDCEAEDVYFRVQGLRN